MLGFDPDSSSSPIDSELQPFKDRLQELHDKAVFTVGRDGSFTMSYSKALQVKFCIHDIGILMIHGIRVNPAQARSLTLHSNDFNNLCHFSKVAVRTLDDGSYSFVAFQHFIGDYDQARFGVAWLIFADDLKELGENKDFIDILES